MPRLFNLIPLIPQEFYIQILHFSGLKSIEVFSNPIPFIPFPLIRGRGNSFERGAITSLKHPCHCEPKAWQSNFGDCFGVSPPSLACIPLPLIREEGEGNRLLTDTKSIDFISNPILLTSALLAYSEIKVVKKR